MVHTSVNSFYFYRLDQHASNIDCNDIFLLYDKHLIYDINHRTETGLIQVHCFLVSELALTAEAQVIKLA